jgi:putative nucleotidyltransferase with HDIG domain
MPVQSVQNSQERLADLLGSLETIATLPEVVARITECVNDPASTPADLHRVLAHDPALTSRLLRLVNSAFYQRSAPIDSVERAIVLLGFSAVHHLAIAATMGAMFRGARICEGYTGRDLWTHCIGVAAVARELARQMREPAPDELFLAGLLHDIGLLVSLQVCRGRLRLACEAARDGRASFTAAEIEFIGVDHQQLGAALARRWRLPQSAQAAAAHHHAPATAEPRWRRMVAVVHVADVICCCRKIGLDLTARLETLDRQVLDIVPPDLVEHATASAAEWAAPAIEVLRD